MNVILIAALAANRVIGVNNSLPWKLPADLKRFKKLTIGNTIIMGRKTFESLRGPLPDRRHICLSRQYTSNSLQPDPRWPEQVFWCGELRAALTLLEKEDTQNTERNVFIIGGAEIYRQALPWADALELTHIHQDIPGDAFFPFFKTLFQKTAETWHSEAELNFSFATYTSLRPKNIIMRKAILADAEFISTAQIHAASESEGLALNHESVHSGVERVFSDSACGEYWIAERHSNEINEPIACLYVQKEWSDWRNGWFHWIHSLFVLPEERRKGICTWMLKVIAEHAQSSATLGLRLYVEKSNAAALKAYLKFGLVGDHYEFLQVEF